MMRFPWACGARLPGLGWFRLFGYGVAWTDHRVRRPLFSERHGYVWALHLGPWCLRWLRP